MNVLAGIARLAESLRRVRSGEDDAGQVVAWLRECSGAACALPMPRPQDAHRDYTRTLLFKNELFEVLVLHWQPNCASAIHDHGGARCWLTVAQGSMNIDNFLRTDTGRNAKSAEIRLEGREQLTVGSIDHRQDDDHVHRCVARDVPTVTVHVYARPIERFRVFDARNSRCSEVISTYDAVLPF